MACNITEESVLYNRKDLYVCGYANIILCAIGTFFNFFIYMVYSQKYMISPMHTIISNLAVVDIICMIVYIPHSWQELIRVTWTRIEEHRTETWEWCSFYSWHLTAMFTHVSIWLTVILGVWRYIGIIHPLKERSWCNTRTTRFAIAACYILGAIVSIPAFLISDVRRTEIPLTNNNTNNCITIYDIEITLDSYDFIFTVTAIFYGVILKILPLAVLAMISYSKRVLVRADPFCGDGLIKFHVYYAEHVCGYLNFPCFAIGILLNVFNVIVFTRKTMISPNNMIFANLAFVDLAAMVTYMPRSWHECIRLQTYSVKEHRTYDWEMVSLQTWHIASIFHGVSLWLTIMLAVWRYIAIAHPLKERQWCDMRRTRNMIIAGYVILPLIWIPAYFDFHVGSLDMLLDTEGYLTSNKTIGISTTISKMQISKLSKLLRSFHMTLYGIFLKIVPSVVLTVFSYKLFVALLQARKRREMLTASMHEGNKVNLKQSTDRTTKMLLVVLGLFFVSEIPHGICCLLTAIYGSKFFLGCYLFLAEPFNSLTLICTSVNFIIYYFMSQQFRNTFNQLFYCKIFEAEKPVEIVPETYRPFDLSSRPSVTTLNSTRSSETTLDITRSPSIATVWKLS